MTPCSRCGNSGIDLRSNTYCGCRWGKTKRDHDRDCAMMEEIMEEQMEYLRREVIGG
jgi:hypothetical protein